MGAVIASTMGSPMGSATAARTTGFLAALSTSESVSKCKADSVWYSRHSPKVVTLPVSRASSITMVSRPWRGSSISPSPMRTR